MAVVDPHLRIATPERELSADLAISADLKEKRRFNPARAKLEQTGLYHSFRLPDGTVAEGAMSLAWQEARLEAFRLPSDLTGKRVLDVGPWDGFYTFEMERRGAEVTAIDVVDLDTFRTLHRAFNSSATYLQAEIYELDPAKLGTFDIVLCLGVLYHLKHPLVALEKLCAITREVCIIDTFVINGRQYLAGEQPPLPYAEFYEKTELAGQADNWCGPTVCNVAAWIRAAGFACAEVTRVTDESACVRAHRKWPALPPEEAPAVSLAAVSSNLNQGRSFNSTKEEYIVLWLNWPDTAPTLDSVFPEIDGFGVAPIGCAKTDGGILVSLRLPPGLQPGSHQARLRIGNAGWSDYLPFHVDLPAPAATPSIRAIQDGTDWQPNQINWSGNGWMTLWADDLSDAADAGNTVVLISGIPHKPVHVDATGQINLQLRPVVGPGLHDVVVLHRGVRTEAWPVRVVGNPPVIRGLETLAAS